MKYFATRDNLTETVIRLQKNLRDFRDYCVRVPAPGGVWAWGWIETDTPIAPGLPGAMGLVPAGRCAHESV